MSAKHPSPESLLLVKAGQRALEPRPREPPWVYGWCVEEHRRPPRAVIPYDEAQVVRFTPAAVEAIESATRQLLSSAPVREAWDDEEIWGVIAGMVATLPMDDGPARTVLQGRLALLRRPGPTLVAFRVAHVRWNAAPMTLAKLRCAIGVVGDDLLDALRRMFGRPPSAPPGWLNGEDAVSHAPPVAFAAVVESAGRRAIEESRQLFAQVVELSLLFDADKGLRGVHSLRGDAFRPGVRGITLDRHAVQAVALEVGPSLGAELAAEVYRCSRISSDISHQWLGEEPWPLDDMLVSPGRQAIVEDIAAGRSALARRYQTAARWYGRAHWADDAADAFLAIGIAFEALLAESGGSPGRVLAERYALLHPQVEDRAGARKYFAKAIYEPRSAVAHGARLSAGAADIRAIERKVAWVAHRLWELATRDSVSTEEEHQGLFEGLKWGTRKS